MLLYKRFSFVSRRGAPVAVFSDNGTDFRGAEAEIKTALEKCNISTTVSENKELDGISTHRSQVTLVESGRELFVPYVRCFALFEFCLLGEQLVDNETRLTFMAEVEKILNDRPLTAASNVNYQCQANYYY